MNILQNINVFQINLMHILIIGPLLFYIGDKKQNNSELVYNMILTLVIMMPFMVGFPSLDFKSSRDINQATHLLLFTAVGYYIYKEQNDLPIIIFDLMKYTGLVIITIHIYLAFEKFKKYY